MTLGGLLLLGLACAGTSTPTLEDVVTHAHPDGFQFSLPSDSDVAHTDGRATVRPEGWRDLRAPYQLVVESTSEPAASSLEEETELEGRQVRFRRDTQPGGSSGAMHILEGHVATPGGATYRLELQELGEGKRAPNEAVFWTVAASLSP